MPVKKYSYYDLLTLLQNNKMIEKVEIADNGHFFTWDSAIGAYMDSNAKFLTEFIFESQMFDPMFVRFSR